jgi:hypothetical protein
MTSSNCGYVLHNGDIKGIQNTERNIEFDHTITALTVAQANGQFQAAVELSKKYPEMSKLVTEKDWFWKPAKHKNDERSVPSSKLPFLFSFSHSLTS